jgi:hypothetical protein
LTEAEFCSIFQTLEGHFANVSISCVGKKLCDFMDHGFFSPPHRRTTAQAFVFFSDFVKIGQSGANGPLEYFQNDCTRFRRYDREVHSLAVYETVFYDLAE